MGLLIYIVTIIVFTFMGGFCVFCHFLNEGYRQIEYKDDKLIIYFENESEIHEFEEFFHGHAHLSLRIQNHKK